jgi:hypothetical protein
MEVNWMDKINGLEPPLSHASTVWDEKNSTLSYVYNRRRVMTVHIPNYIEPAFRVVSDGNLCSHPMTQQMYISLPEYSWVRVDISLSSDAINMRPQRANSGEAILGQCGRPLIYDANGVYDINDDLLISWYGCEWRWLDKNIQQDGNVSSCAMEVKLGPTPWVLLFHIQYYRTHLGFRYHSPWHTKPNRKPVTGWCSWEAYHRDISADHISETVAFLSNKFKPFGLEYIQIDDGYQNTPQPVNVEDAYYGIFLKTNKKFPNGHQDITIPIKGKGFEPGIWTNVSITNPYFANHAPFIFKDENGEPIACDWLGYCMDCTHKTINEQVKPLYKGLKDAGYTYFKTDSIRHFLYDGLRKMVNEGLLTNEEANRRFRAFMEGARESIGDDAYFLACWGVLSEVVGIADACRIATDAGPNWSQIRMQLFETARWFSTQRILYTNDPDHICVRAELEYARSVLSLVTLSGGLYMLSDMVDKYDNKRVNIIRRTMPALDTMTAETGPMNYTEHAWGRVFNWDKAATHEENPFGSLWCVHFSDNHRNWAVAGRFAIEELKRSKVPFEKLGLNPKGRYAAYDFWDEKYLGIVTDKMVFKPLNMGCCQIVVLRAVDDVPCLIASDRHISMDAISVVSEQYKDGELILALKGVQGFKFKYWVFVPEGMQAVAVSSRGAEAVLQKMEQISIVQIYFIEKNVKLRIIFEESGIRK